MQCVAAILRRDIGPNFKSIFRRLDRLLNVFVIALRHGIDGRARGRIAHFGGIFRYGIDGFAADKHLSHRLTSIC